MTRPGDDRRDISKRSGGPTRLGATGGHAAGPTTGSAAAAAARTNREGAPFAFATHKGALQSPADDDDEFYYDSTLTDSNDDPSRSLEDAADWSHTLDSPSESNINKTIIRTSNPNRNESPAWLQTPISGPQRRSLNSCYASRGRQPPLVLEQEFEVGISEDETHQVVEIEEVEETDDFESDVDREGDEIDEEKHWDPPAPPPGHRLCHYHVTETIGTAEAVAYTIKAAAKPVVTAKHVPAPEPVITAKHVPTPEPVITVKHVPTPDPHVPTSDPLITVKRVPTPEPAAAIAMIKTERVVTKPKPTRPTVPMIFSDTCSIERRTLKDRPTLTGSSVPISSLVAETTAKNVRTAGSIYGSAGFLSGPSSRKVQYNRQPEVHEYTKDSSGSCMGTRLEWKRQQDGVVLVDVGPPLTKEEEAERRRMQREMEAWQKQDKAQQVRIRIAVSANNLRRNRSPECQDTDRQPGVNRAEVSRSHKLRASTEQPEPTIFNEVEDNRVHVTALCKEHMSLRGVTVPPSLPSPPAGRSAAGHGSMVATTGTYAEGKHYGDSFGRTERPGPNPTLSRKLRRHIMYAPQLKTGVPRDFLVYFLVSMTTLASIFAAIGVFSQHESSEHLDENPLQNSPGPSYSVNFSEPLSLRLSRRLTKTKNFSVCKTIECQREGAYLASTLNWALDPCADFHAFVCRSSRATRLQEVEQRVAVRLRQPSLSAPLVHLQRLRRECLEPKGRSWSQLRGLLDVLALEGWPFADSRNVSHDRVWEVAANLERRLGIASLLAVSRQPGSKLLVLNTAPVWSRGEDDFMTSRYHKFAGALRGEPAIDTLSQATQVVQLARELSDLPSKSSMVRTRIRDSPYKLFLSSLINTSDSEDQGHLDVLFSRQLASQLTKLLDRVEPHVILNYQGFLVSLSVEPLLPGANSSEPQCWRLVEDALPELFLYAAFLDQRSVMAAVSNMTDTVKRNVMLYVNSASWMEASVRRESVERLRELRVHAFVPPWFWAANRVRVQFGKLTQVGSSKGITAMAAFKEQSQGRLLRGDAWPTAPTDSRCAYDSSMRTVYLPLLAANLSGSPAEPLTLTRLPRMGPQLAACLLHVVTSGAGRWWGARTVRNLQPLRKCVVSQAPEEADPDQLLEQLAALAPVHNIYDERVRARSAQDRDYRLQHAENVTSAQLFFVYYGMAQCHASPERVNLPLQNYEPFRKAFGCRIGTFMAPANTCRFWAA
ncbi:unnamed protein product [Ixodes hexagonus]